jgi:hypothetical protein
LWAHNIFFATRIHNYPARNQERKSIPICNAVTSHFNGIELRGIPIYHFSQAPFHEITDNSPITAISS